jgi:hypothetical protein
MSLHDLIYTNFRRKLFSLMLAILIWLTIHFADKPHQGGTGLPQKSLTNAVILP